MKRILFSFAALFAFCALAAVPTVDNVKIEQSSMRRVVISYDLLDADGVVTVELITNGAPISATTTASMRGDINKIVKAGVGRKITWKPSKEWPEGGVISGEISCKLTAWPVSSPSPYMVANLDGSKVIEYYASEEALPGGITSRVYRTDKMVFRMIPAANVTFRSGAPSWEAGFKTTESLHYVTLTNNFYLGVFPVTQGQYQKIMGNNVNNPSSNPGAADYELCPLDHVNSPLLGWGYGSRPDVNDFSASDGFLKSARNNTGFDRLFLPTRAEWEFACRAGSNDPVYGGYQLDEVAWYADNSGGALKPVGLKKPNAFGLYDMLGNVAERVRDSASFQGNSGFQIAPYYGETSHGGHLIMCGGSFSSSPENVRASAWVKGSGSAINPNTGNMEDMYYYYSSAGFGVRLLLPLK